MTRTSNTLREQLLRQFVATHQRVFGAMHRRPPKNWSTMELTMPQMRTLMLMMEQPRRMGEIATYLHCNLSSATGMVDRLVEKGLAERTHDESDRRVVSCRLTRAGESEVERFWRIGRERTRELAELLTDDELKKVNEAGEIILSAIERAAKNGEACPDAS